MSVSLMCLGGRELELAEAQEIVTFLTSVPLFKNQLPRSELPKAACHECARIEGEALKLRVIEHRAPVLWKVARNLKRKVWEPGTEIVKQGDLGRDTFLIHG